MTDKRVLIADDDPDLARALALRCKQLGVDTHVVHDAMTALTMAHNEKPDLICLDVNMPGGNGLSACEMISQSEDLAGIPVIILTGCYDEETIRRCHNMCAYYVLKCPDIWHRMEPLVQELLQLDSSSGTPSDDHPSDEDRSRSELYQEIARDVVYAQMDDEA